MMSVISGHDDRLWVSKHDVILSFKKAILLTQPKVTVVRSTVQIYSVIHDFFRFPNIYQDGRRAETTGF